MVYVLAKDGSPLMPTERCGKVRHMLRDGRAKCVRREPFTIQLTYETPRFTQDITLGVDCGSRYVGLSATTEEAELFAAELELRTDVSRNIMARRDFRRARRSRKTRYRETRYYNRRHPDGWLPPSVRNKLLAHADVIDWVCGFLPVTEAILEIDEFDTQKLADPDISGVEYQHGAQYGFYNVRQYVLWRDGYICQCCGGGSGDKRLSVSHIVRRANGGSDRPGNLVTLCGVCRKAYHAGELLLPEPGAGPGMRGAAHMNDMRHAVLDEVRKRHPDLTVSHTYGCVTKAVREERGIAKTHAADARVISSHPDAAPLGSVYKMRKVRRHNRQIHKAKILKGGVRKRNQAAYEVNGFRLFDKVELNGTLCFISGRRTSGGFAVKTFEKTISTSVTYRKLTLIKHQPRYLIEFMPMA